MTNEIDGFLKLGHASVRVDAIEAIEGPDGSHDRVLVHLRSGSMIEVDPEEIGKAIQWVCDD